jgi:hypothetical protein
MPFKELSVYDLLLVRNVGPKSDHMEKSDLAKRFFIAGQVLKYPSVRLSMI